MMLTKRGNSIRTVPLTRAACIMAAAVCLFGSLYLSYNHEPDNETVSFSSEISEEGQTQNVHSTAKTYLFQYTGEDADSVHWDFGDGTSADAFEVYKTYAGPGTYNVLCSAMNFGGTRVSGMPLTIEDKEYGLFEGYSDELLLLSFGFMFMILAYAVGKNDPSVIRPVRRR